MKKIYIPFLFLIALVWACTDDFSSNGNFEVIDGGGTSQGGSTARFAIVDDYLYIVNDFSLIPIAIQNLNNPIQLEEVEIGLGIETLFPYGDYLFIGSNDAVYIYGLENPAKPEFISIYQHNFGCDPVVVSGQYAYVTLRQGISCRTVVDVNLLEVLDISNIQNPINVSAINMTNPRGLAVGCSNKLYVCEGPGGIVEFDLSNPALPVEIRRYSKYSANDLIIRNDLVIVTGDDGVYQYSCATDSLQLLSLLPFAL